MIKTITNPKIYIWPAAVLVIHVLASVFGWYDAIWWFDTPMHFAGGMAIALSTYYYLQTDKETKTSLISFFQILVGTTAIAAIFWEFFEFTIDYFYQTHNQISIADTMKDLAMGLLGAIIIAIIKTSKK